MPEKDSLPDEEQVPQPEPSATAPDASRAPGTSEPNVSPAHETPSTSTAAEPALDAGAVATADQTPQLSEPEKRGLEDVPAVSDGLEPALLAPGPEPRADGLADGNSSEDAPLQVAPKSAIFDGRDEDHPGIEPVRRPLLERMGIEPGPTEKAATDQGVAKLEAADQSENDQPFDPSAESDPAPAAPVGHAREPQLDSVGFDHSESVESHESAAALLLSVAARASTAARQMPAVTPRRSPAVVMPVWPTMALKSTPDLEPPPRIKPEPQPEVRSEVPSAPDPERSKPTLDSPPAAPVTSDLPMRSWIRRAGSFALRAVAVYAALLVFLVAVFRFVDPPGSALMALRWLGGTSVDRTWVPISSISPHLVRAVIVSEDWTFCSHYGIDVEAMQQAIEKAKGGIPRGASTISMQVTKNMFLWPSKSYVRKAIEVPLTFVMELLWPKRRILEVYLNVAEWGPGIFGAEAAARHHFQKSAASLTSREAAQLAASLPNPIQRDASDPGRGTARKAGIVQARMRIAGSVANCVLAPNGADATREN